jgi:creatinine amidohydrolase
MRMIVAACSALALASAAGPPQPDRPAGLALADLSWQQAEPALTPSTVVVIPLGASAVEQGPHLKLDAGERLARYLALRVQAGASVVVAPPFTYHYFPAYVQYPGSTTLGQTTARDLTVDVVRSLARFGPKRFYILNTGGAAIRPLADAARVLADSGILLGWTDMRYQLQSAEIKRQQRDVQGAPHADEIETSMMLAIDPGRVDMTKAVAEYARGTGVLTRTDKERDDAPGIVSKTGVLGDPTLATAEKGRVLIDTIVAGALRDIETLRATPLPPVKPATPASPSAPRPVPQGNRGPRAASGCTEGDDRTIRDVGTKFSYQWRQMDALEISKLFALRGDIRHPDGTIERTREIIRQNRAELFQRKEYRGSIHPVTIYDVRCLDDSHAIADGKWELRFADSAGPGNPGRPASATPSYSGLFTLVLSGQDGEWLIEAWRYTVNPPEGTPPPTTLKQPGFIGRGF